MITANINPTNNNNTASDIKTAGKTGDANSGDVATWLVIDIEFDVEFVTVVTVVEFDVEVSDIVVLDIVDLELIVPKEVVIVGCLLVVDIVVDVALLHSATTQTLFIAHAQPESAQHSKQLRSADAYFSLCKMHVAVFPVLNDPTEPLKRFSPISSFVSLESKEKTIVAVRSIKALF